MQTFSRSLGDAVKVARGRLDLTQNEVADKIDVDVRTIINIENYRGNPKMEVLFPLIRALKIDAREVFNPELKRESPSIRQLRFLVEECSEEDAVVLIPVIEAVLTALKSRTAILIDEETK